MVHNIDIVEDLSGFMAFKEVFFLSSAAPYVTSRVTVDWDVQPQNELKHDV